MAAETMLSTSQSTLDPSAMSGVRAIYSGTEGAYLLPHNDTEIERLQRQHRLLKTATNGKLVPAMLPKDAAVLDSGCADGESHVISCSSHHKCFLRVDR